MATYNLRRNVKSWSDCNYNFTILNWLLLNLDNINIDGDTLTVPAANITGLLRAGQVIVGEDTIFEEGYNPFDKVDPDDLDAMEAALELYVNQRASSVQDIAEAIANGEFQGGSFINGKYIYSPIISGQDAYFEGTIRIGNGKFSVDYYGNLSAANGNFAVPWDGDGVYNNYAASESSYTAARWKRDNSNYIYQDPNMFAVYVDGAQQLIVRSGGAIFAVESASNKRLATQEWATNNIVARFG